MTGPIKSDEEDVKPEELAALAKGLRRSALRDSNPDIVATSNGHEAAAYQGAPATPPSPNNRTIPMGGVKLSATLQRDIAELNKPRPPAPPPATSPSRRFDVTVPGGPRVRATRRAAWIVGGLGLILLVTAILAVGTRKKPTEPAPPSATSMPVPVVTPTAAATTPAAIAPGASPVDPGAAPAPAASASAAPVTSRPRPAGHPSATTPPSSGHSGSGGSGEMINPPL